MHSISFIGLDFFNSTSVKDLNYFFYYFLIFSESSLLICNNLFKIDFQKSKLLQKLSYFFIYFINYRVLLAFFILLSLFINPELKNFIKKSIDYKSTSPFHSKDWINYLDDRTKLINYTNKNLHKPESLFVIPFKDIDMESYLDVEVFLTYFSIIKSSRYNKKSINEFERLIREDLNLTIEDVFFTKNKFDPLKIDNTWSNVWKNLDMRTIKKWKRKHNITHIVREVDMPLDLNIIYSNDSYYIYDLIGV
jgi:hypothetical protein